jgi:hypothetical protein
MTRALPDDEGRLPRTPRPIRIRRAATLHAPTNAGAEFLLVAAIYVAYTTSRLIVEGPREVAIANARTVLRIERALGLDWESSAQASVLSRPDTIGFWNFVYVWVYWPAVVIALVVLWKRDRVSYALLRNALAISAVIGIVIFGLFPVSPPRFLDGYVDTLDVHGGRVVDERGAFVNEYAAVPSFHVGWPALAGVIVGLSIRSVAAWALALSPALVLVPAVVVTGNHFVFDVLAGLAVTFTSLLIARQLSIRAPPNVQPSN